MPSARPRNALVGHAIGILCGYAAPVLFGLAHAPSATIIGVSDPRMLAAGLSLAVTARR